MDKLTVTIFVGQYLRNNDTLTSQKLQDFIVSENYERISFNEIEIVLDSLVLAEFLETFELDNVRYWNPKNKVYKITQIIETKVEPLNLNQKLWSTDLSQTATK
jgi:hypothetical protein